MRDKWFIKRSSVCRLFISLQNELIGIYEQLHVKVFRFIAAPIILFLSNQSQMLTIKVNWECFVYRIDY